MSESLRNCIWKAQLLAGGSSWKSHEDRDPWSATASYWLANMRTDFSYVSERKVQRKQSKAFFSDAQWQDESGHKLEHRRFLNCRKHFFAVTVTKKWHRFPVMWWSLYSCTCLEAVWTQSRATLTNSLTMSLCENDTAWRKANSSPVKQGISCKECELLLLSEGLLTNKSRLKKGFVGIRKQQGSRMVSHLL